MSFGGFLDNSASSGGGGATARIVADIPYNNSNDNNIAKNDNNSNNMPSTAIAQPRLVTQSLTKSMFNSPGLSLALVITKKKNPELSTFSLYTQAYKSYFYKKLTCGWFFFFLIIFLGFSKRI